RRLGYPCALLEVWPTLPWAEWEGRVRELSQAWQTYLAGFGEGSLDGQGRYTDSKGGDWANSVAGVLTHVVLHSSYHRGQIASFLGRTGHTPAYSDYIECVRHGYLERGWPA